MTILVAFHQNQSAQFQTLLPRLCLCLLAGCLSWLAQLSTLCRMDPEVSIDLWKPYKSVVEELIPNAQVVADIFHVMKQINEELDARRKQEKRQAEKLKNKKEREQKIHREKERLRDIFESQITGYEVLWKMVEWTQSSYKYFPKSCQTIKRWIDEILTF